MSTYTCMLLCLPISLCFLVSARLFYQFLTVSQTCILLHLYLCLKLMKLSLSSCQQDEYEGLINEVAKEDSSEGDSTSSYYPFGISSLVNKREPLQIGDKVFMTFFLLMLISYTR